MAETTRETVVVRKRSDAYTGILAISFLAMTGGCVLLYLEYQNYEKQTPPPGPKIDVPGAVLKTNPNSGTAPRIELKKDAGDAPKDPKDMGMQQGPALAPALLTTVEIVPNEKATAEKEVVTGPEPISPVQAVKGAAALESVIDIPDPSLPGPPAPIDVPTTSAEPRKAPMTAPMSPRPIISTLEPNLSDEPPIPPKRFDPPK